MQEQDVEFVDRCALAPNYTKNCFQVVIFDIIRRQFGSTYSTFCFCIWNLNCGFELLPHPAYSPDSAPSDFHLFPNLKKHLERIKFSSIEMLQVAVNEYFENLEESFFKKDIMALETRWKKRIELGGDYIKK